jgi:hypothetical protein
VNAVPATVAVSLWNGSEWVAAVDILDNTIVQPTGTTALAASGEVTFAQDIDDSTWSMEQDSADVTGLSGTAIYNMYWARFHWSANLTAGTTLKYVGFLFSSDTDLLTFYPDLQNSSLKTAYASGKTTWTDQGFAASEAIVRELRRRNIVASPNQIFDTSLLLEANVHKTAEIIYGGLGSSYVEAKNKAAEAYKNAIDIKFFSVDSDGSGTISGAEKYLGMGFMRR